MNLITTLTITPYQGASLTFDQENFILSSVKGLESPTVRLPRFNLPGSSGAFISNALYGERAITLTGYVNAPDGNRLTYLANRQALIDVLINQVTTSGTIVPLTLTITLETGSTLTCQAYVQKEVTMGFASDQTDWGSFSVGLVSPDYLLYSNQVQSYTVGLPVGGGTAIPTALPASLAPASGGVLTISNNGQPVAPQIILYPPLTNPYITNETTGGFLAFNYTLNVGDQPLVIDCASQTITQGTNTKNGIQSYDSTFWQLAPGDNRIGFSATGGTGTAVISFYPTTLGI